VKPEETRQRVIEEHEKIRELLGEIDRANERFAQGSADGSEVRELAAGLFEVFAAHLALEDSLLAPALVALGDGGPWLAERLHREHREQRATLIALVELIEQAGQPSARIVDELHKFSDAVRNDMQHEEETILREDVLSDC